MPRKNPQLSDLVRDSKIETEFLASHVQHVFHETGRSLRRRRVRRVECWTKDRLLGRGAFGKVHLHVCRDDEGDKFRAVKEVKKCVVLGQELDYNTELEAIMKFSHPKYSHCFVSSQGWYELGDSIFITMEFFELGDLQQYLAAPLLESEAKQITDQILEGLDHMHDNGFIHRDLKPANIMVVDRGPDWFVKIADFGISKRRHHDTATLTMQRGTLGFVAPEVIGAVPDKLYTYSVDMWSLGAMAYRILTCAMAFQSFDDLFQYVHGMLEFPMDPLASLGISERGQDFIINLMRPRPADRLSARSAASHPWITTLLPRQEEVPQNSHPDLGMEVPADATGISIASKAWSSESGTIALPERPREAVDKSEILSDQSHEGADNSSTTSEGSDESDDDSSQQTKNLKAHESNGQVAHDAEPDASTATRDPNPWGFSAFSKEKKSNRSLQPKTEASGDGLWGITPKNPAADNAKLQSAPELGNLSESDGHKDVWGSWGVPKKNTKQVPLEEEETKTDGAAEDLWDSWGKKPKKPESVNPTTRPGETSDTPNDDDIWGSWVTKKEKKKKKKSLHSGDDTEPKNSESTPRVHKDDAQPSTNRQKSMALSKIAESIREDNSHQAFSNISDEEETLKRPLHNDPVEREGSEDDNSWNDSDDCYNSYSEVSTSSEFSTRSPQPKRPERPHTSQPRRCVYCGDISVMVDIQPCRHALCHSCALQHFAILLIHPRTPKPCCGRSPEDCKFASRLLVDPRINTIWNRYRRLLAGDGWSCLNGHSLLDTTDVTTPERAPLWKELVRCSRCVLQAKMGGYAVAVRSGRLAALCLFCGNQVKGDECREPGCEHGAIVWPFIKKLRDNGVFTVPWMQKAVERTWGHGYIEGTHVLRTNAFTQRELWNWPGTPFSSRGERDLTGTRTSIAAGGSPSSGSPARYWEQAPPKSLSTERRTDDDTESESESARESEESEAEESMSDAESNPRRQQGGRRELERMRRQMEEDQLYVTLLEQQEGKEGLDQERRRELRRIQRQVEETKHRVTLLQLQRVKREVDKLYEREVEREIEREVDKERESQRDRELDRKRASERVRERQREAEAKRRREIARGSWRGKEAFEGRRRYYLTDADADSSGPSEPQAGLNSAPPKRHLPRRPLQATRGADQIYCCRCCLAFDGNRLPALGVFVKCDSCNLPICGRCHGEECARIDDRASRIAKQKRSAQPSPSHVLFLPTATPTRHQNAHATDEAEERSGSHQEAPPAPTKVRQIRMITCTYCTAQFTREVVPGKKPVGTCPSCHLFICFECGRPYAACPKGSNCLARGSKSVVVLPPNQSAGPSSAQPGPSEARGTRPPLAEGPPSAGREPFYHPASGYPVTVSQPRRYGPDDVRYSNYPGPGTTG